MQRVANRHDDGTGGKSDSTGLGGDIPKVDKRIKDLAEIAKAWIAQRNIAHPEGCETCSLGSLSQFGLTFHRGRIAGEGLYRKKRPNVSRPDLKVRAKPGWAEQGNVEGDSMASDSCIEVTPPMRILLDASNDVLHRTQRAFQLVVAITTLVPAVVAKQAVIAQVAE